MSAAREQAINAVIEAIRNAGPRPDVHMETMQRHRYEWPALWTALDTLVDIDAAERRGDACMTYLWGSSCVLSGEHSMHRNQYGEEWADGPRWGRAPGQP